MVKEIHYLIRFHSLATVFFNKNLFLFKIHQYSPVSDPWSSVISVGWLGRATGVCLGNSYP